MELKELIEQKFADLVVFQEKAQADIKAAGEVATETKSAIETLQTDLDAMKLQIEKQESRELSTEKGIAADLRENDSFQRLMRDKSGTAVLHFKSFRELEHKATITSSAVGNATSGVLVPERDGGTVPLARKRIFIRNLLRAVPTTANAGRWRRT